MAHKIYENVVVKGNITAEAPASTGAYRVVVQNNTTKRFESVDPSEIGGGGGGGLPAGCFAACGIIQGKNFTTEYGSGNGCRYWLQYRVGNLSTDDVKSTNIVESDSEEIQYPFFANVQPVYLFATAELSINNTAVNEVDIPSIPNYAVALVVAVNGLIVFAKTLSPGTISAYLGGTTEGPWEIPFEGTDGPSIIGPAWGYVVFVLSPLNSDTNYTDQGVLALGQDALFAVTGTTFSAQVQTIGGGLSSESLNVSTESPAVPVYPLESGFSWTSFGSNATSGQLVVTGHNSEAGNLYVQIVSTFDAGLNSYELVEPGDDYTKVVPLSVAQLQNNDFYVNITPNPPEEP